MTKQLSWRDASGRLTYDFVEIDSTDYVATCERISSEFALEPDGAPLIGPDQYFGRFARNDLSVHIDWDVWLCLIVTAADAQSEELATEISSWLQRMIDTGRIPG